MSASCPFARSATGPAPYARAAWFCAQACPSADDFRLRPGSSLWPFPDGGSGQATAYPEGGTGARPYDAGRHFTSVGHLRPRNGGADWNDAVTDGQRRDPDQGAVPSCQFVGNGPVLLHRVRAGGFRDLSRCRTQGTCRNRDLPACPCKLYAAVADGGALYQPGR